MIHATFNNISAISLSSVLLVEEIGIFGENHRPVAIHQETLSHNVLSSTHRQLLVVICTYCIARCNPTTLRSRPLKAKQSRNLFSFVCVVSFSIVTTNCNGGERLWHRTAKRRTCHWVPSGEVDWVSKTSPHQFYIYLLYTYIVYVLVLQNQCINIK
jgi:hypothetical protein